MALWSRLVDSAARALTLVVLTAVIVKTNVQQYCRRLGAYPQLRKAAAVASTTLLCMLIAYWYLRSTTWTGASRSHVSVPCSISEHTCYAAAKHTPGLSSFVPVAADAPMYALCDMRDPAAPRLVPMPQWRAATDSPPIVKSRDITGSGTSVRFRAERSILATTTCDSGTAWPQAEMLSGQDANDYQIATALLDCAARGSFVGVHACLQMR